MSAHSLSRKGSACRGSDLGQSAVSSVGGRGRGNGATLVGAAVPHPGDSVLIAAAVATPHAIVGIVGSPAAGKPSRDPRSCPEGEPMVVDPIVVAEAHAGE
eukprot:5231240-Prymnesium_polylepis.1